MRTDDLTRTQMAILRATEHASSTADIAEACKAHIVYVRQQLVKMEEAGLITRIDAAWKANVTIRIEEVKK
jgi:DNA-binding MarR family transcriptional regulator